MSKTPRSCTGTLGAFPCSNWASMVASSLAKRRRQRHSSLQQAARQNTIKRIDHGLIRQCLWCCCCCCCCWWWWWWWCCCCCCCCCCWCCWCCWCCCCCCCCCCWFAGDTQALSLKCIVGYPPVCLVFHPGINAASSKGFELIHFDFDSEEEQCWMTLTIALRIKPTPTKAQFRVSRKCYIAALASIRKKRSKTPFFIDTSWPKCFTCWILQKPCLTQIWMVLTY